MATRAILMVLLLGVSGCASAPAAGGVPTAPPAAEASTAVVRAWSADGCPSLEFEAELQPPGGRFPTTCTGKPEHPSVLLELTDMNALVIRSREAWPRAVDVTLRSWRFEALQAFVRGADGGTRAACNVVDERCNAAPFELLAHDTKVVGRRAISDDVSVDVLEETVRLRIHTSGLARGEVLALQWIDAYRR